MPEEIKKNSIPREETELLCDYTYIYKLKGGTMKKEILDWIDQEIERLDQKPESQPEQVPEAFRLAMKAIVEGIAWH
jgi:hypothetical protein